MKEKVVAKDRTGNEYEKEVTLRELKGGLTSRDPHGNWLLDFGQAMQFGVTGLLRNFPYQTSLCIDMGGRLHGGTTHVVVSADDINKLLLKACEELEIDPEGYSKQATDAPSTTPPSSRNAALEDLAKKVKEDIDNGHTNGVQETPGDVQEGSDSEDV